MKRLRVKFSNDAARSTLRYCVLTACLLSSPLKATTAVYPLSYSARLTDGNGSPLEGLIDVDVKFFATESSTTLLGQNFLFTGVALDQGVLTLSINMMDSQVAAVFGDGSETVYIELTADGKTYPRQRYSFVPLALRVPIDQKTLSFDPNGKLGISLKTQPGTNQFLTKNGSGELTWGSPAVVTASSIQGKTVSSTQPQAGQILTYSGSEWIPQTPVNGSGSGTLSVGQGGTGATSFTNNGVLVGAGAGPVSATAAGTQENVLKVGASGPEFGKVNLASSAAVSGKLALANGGTGSDLAATGGSGQYVKQSTSGGPLSVGAIQPEDITTALGSMLATATASGTGPGWSASGNTHTLSIPMASNAGVVAGLLSNGDYSTFASKVGSVSAGTGITASPSGSSVTLGLDTIGTAGTYAKVTTDAYGRVVSGATLSTSDLPPLTAMVGADGNAAGKAGAVPAPAATDDAKFLRGDGTWSTPPATGGGAANEIQYNSGGMLTGNSSFVYAAGNVGIGTTAPGKLIQASRANSSFMFDDEGGIPVAGIYSSTAAATSVLTVGNGTRAWQLRLDGGDGSKLKIYDVTAIAARMTFDSSGNVGIGTTSPAGTLDVAGSICLNGANCITSWPISGGNLATSGSDSYLSSGKLGLGTSSPAADLSFDGTLARTVQVDRNTGAGTTGGGLTVQAGGAISGGSNFNGGTLTLASGVATGTGTSTIEFKTASAGSSGATDSSPTTKLTILGNGNVGIGSTAPAQRLDVAGTIRGSAFATNLGSWAETFGGDATATGQWSTAIGNGSSAGQKGTVLGANAKGSGNWSIAIGYGASANGNNIVIGEENASVTTPNTFVAGSPNTPMTQVYFGKGASNSSPTAYTLSGTSGSGSNVNGGALQLAGGASTGTGAGGALIFQTSAASGTSGSMANSLAERMRIDQLGNVGIGTTAPGSRLSVYGNSNPELGVNTPSSGTLRLGVATIAGNIVTNALANAAILTNDTGPLQLGAGSAAPSSAAITVATSGNVGIGTTSPQSIFHVAVPGNAGQPAATFEATEPNSHFGSWLDLRTNGASKVAMNWWGDSSSTPGGNFSIATTDETNGGLYQRLWIDSKGGVVVGERYIQNPLLQVMGHEPSILLTNTQDYTYNNNWVLRTGSSATSTPEGAFSIGDNNGLRLVINQTGKVGIGTTSPSYTLHVNGSVAGNGAYIALSDIRFKKDVQDLVGSLAKVLAIRGVSYKWIDEDKNGSGTQYGVIAQEIEKILPDVVVTGSDGIKRVKYDDLIPLIIEALKSEKASKDVEIAQLKAESAQLKAESAQLKASLCGKFPDLPVCSN